MQNTENVIKLEIRPTCSVPGCENKAAHIVGKSHPRYPRYRKSAWIFDLYPEATSNWCCGSCHSKNTARVHGVKSAGHLTAQRAGMTYQEWKEQRHPYLWARNDYCENKDGRLGFKCNITLPTREMLDAAGHNEWMPKQFLEVDHIDGNSDNNVEDNLQTLCKHCHMMKTYKEGDNRTLGRTKIRQQKLGKASGN